MIRTTYTRVIGTALAGTLALGLAAAPAFAQNGPGGPGQSGQVTCQPNQPCPQQGQQGQPGNKPQGGPGQQQQGHQNGGNNGGHGDMQQLSQNQRDHLPKLPQGQSYRKQGDKIVRVDSDTGAVIAVLGLAAILLANQ